MELIGPSRWRCIDFISDLHLHASDSRTYHAWRIYLEQTAADAVFILGDLFDVWVGDDVLSIPEGFERQCTDVLRAAARRVDLYIMCGNRDFLMGASLMAECGCTLLDDPTVLSFADQRWLLTHGDALCHGDIDYMHFRAKVRNPRWQQDFLGNPLTERLNLARAMRTESETHKNDAALYVDLDSRATLALLQSQDAGHMVHGHTHRPARHLVGGGRERLTLSDWDQCAKPARAEVLRIRRSSQILDANYTVERIPPAMATVTQRTAQPLKASAG